MKRMMVVILLVFGFISFCQAETLHDDFSKKELEGRLLQRGAWKLENNVLSCQSDPELYKKYANHGPIIRYEKDFKDISVEFDMKVKDCERVVFTLNGDGHIFRVIMSDQSRGLKEGGKKNISRLLAWATKSSKTNKGDTFKPEGLPGIPDINDQWVKVKLEIKGDKGTLQIGEFKHSLEHASLARQKNQLTLSFAYGYLSMKNFKMTTTN